MHSNQNKSAQTKIEKEQNIRNSSESIDDQTKEDVNKGLNAVTENISELRVDQAEEKASKNLEVNTYDVKEKNLNTKSLVFINLL